VQGFLQCAAFLEVIHGAIGSFFFTVIHSITF